jgi:hypothetical protein
MIFKAVNNVVMLCRKEVVQQVMLAVAEAYAATVDQADFVAFGIFYPTAVDTMYCDE